MLSFCAHLFRDSVQSNHRCNVKQNKIAFIIILMGFGRYFLNHILIKNKFKEHSIEQHIYKQLFPTFPLNESISVLSCFMVRVEFLWPHCFWSVQIKLNGFTLFNIFPIFSCRKTDRIYALPSAKMVGSSVEFQSQVSICFTSCRLIYSIIVSVEIGG